MNLDSEFTYGKYKGWTLEEVWTGCNHDRGHQIVRAYISEFLDILSRRSPQHYSLPLSDNIKALRIDALGDKNIKRSLLQGSFTTVLEKNIVIDHCNDPTTLSLFVKLIIDSLAASYNNLSYTSNYLSPHKSSDNLEYSSNSMDFLSLKANPAYIKWSIENKDDFTISPSDLDKLLNTESRRLKTIDIKIISNNVLEYKPIFYGYKYSLPCEVIEMNTIKYNM